MLDPIIKTIEVPCSQAKAFDVFLNEMDSWWPPGTESLWGTIKSYQPHDFVSMDFHFAPPGEKVDARTLVEVRFTAIGNQRTRVVLTQSNWEAFGEKAAMLRDRGYGQAWVAIFEGAFKSACGG